MSNIVHEVTNGSCTQCGELEDWLRDHGQTVVVATEGIRVHGVRHDAVHSLRVDQTAIPGERVQRTFWCTCGDRFGTSYDAPALAAYRVHRKVTG